MSGREIGARPRVTLKLATSLDGKIATRGGESRWITGEEARRAGHGLRAAHDAVLVGSQTAAADDPELSVRLDGAAGNAPGERQPLRVVMDTRLRTSAQSRLVRTAGLGPIVLLAGRDADPMAKRTLEAAGARVALIKRSPEGVDLEAALGHLKEVENVETLLVEGGGVLAASFLAAGCVDRLEWFRAPVILGGEARPGVAELGVAVLSQAPRFARVSVREVGVDLWESYERAA